jgi:hypothetical protein
MKKLSKLDLFCHLLGFLGSLWAIFLTWDMGFVGVIWPINCLMWIIISFISQIEIAQLKMTIKKIENGNK